MGIESLTENAQDKSTEKKLSDTAKIYDRTLPNGVYGKIYSALPAFAQKYVDKIQQYRKMNLSGLKA